jgi:hypothetical protein
VNEQNGERDDPNHPMGKAAPVPCGFVSDIIETKRCQREKAKDRRESNPAGSILRHRPADLHVDRDERSGDDQERISADTMQDDEEVLGRVVLLSELARDTNPFVEDEPRDPRREQ